MLYKSERGSVILIVLITVLITSSILVGGYFIFTNLIGARNPEHKPLEFPIDNDNSSDLYATDGPMELQTPKPQVQISPVEEWKTYAAEPLKMTLKYPSEVMNVEKVEEQKYIFYYNDKISKEDAMGSSKLSPLLTIVFYPNNTEDPELFGRNLHEQRTGKSLTDADFYAGKARKNLREWFTLSLVDKSLSEVERYNGEGPKTEFIVQNGGIVVIDTNYSQAKGVKYSQSSSIFLIEKVKDTIRFSD